MEIGDLVEEDYLFQGRDSRAVPTAFIPLARVAVDGHKLPPGAGRSQKNKGSDCRQIQSRMALLIAPEHQDSLAGGGVGG